MARFQAVFAISVELNETDYYTTFPLSALTLVDAESEALRLPRALGANIVRIIEAGMEVSRIRLRSDD